MNVREWALPVYTILVQLAVGTLLMLWIVRAVSISRSGEADGERIVKFPVLIVFITAVVGIGGAHFHLSRPFYSLYSVLNFRTSWLSREIAFTILFFLTTTSLTVLEWFAPDRARLKTVLGWVAIAFGAAAVYCMSHIYLLPTQAAWNSPLTIVSFGLTMLLLGSVAMPAILLIDLMFSSDVSKTDPAAWRNAFIRKTLIGSTGAAVIIWCAIAGLTIYQISLLRLGDPWAQTSFDLLTHLYQPLLILRSVLPFVGIAWLVVAIARIIKNGHEIFELTVPVYVSCICVLAGEILGRFLFYATHVRIGV